MFDMFDKKKVLRSVSMGMSTVVIVGAGLLSGCAPAAVDNGSGGAGNSTPSPSPSVQESNTDKIMPEFMSLVGENPKPAVLIEFMDKNIAAVRRMMHPKCWWSWKRSRRIIKVFWRRNITRQIFRKV